MNLKRKTNVNRLIIALSVFTAFNVGCDHGLTPPAEVPAGISGISGTILYTNWPDLQTIKNLKIVVFKKFPPGDILGEVLSGEATAYPPDLNKSLPKGVDSTTYVIELKSGVYEYVVVAQQFGGLYDWRAVGQYDTTAQDSLPTAIEVPANIFLEKIDIVVDFNNLPIQPF